MGVIKERVAIPNFDSLLPTLKSPKEIKDILIKNKITAVDIIRPMFTGVYFDEKGIVAASDAYNLVCVKYDTDEEQFKPFEGKCIDNRMSVDYNEKLGGIVIKGNYPDYPRVIPEEAEYKVDIEITKGLLSFLKKYSSGQLKRFNIKQGDFEIILNPSLLYRNFKALYELGETKITAYASDRHRAVSFVGKTTFSLLMPMLVEVNIGEFTAETFTVVEKDGITDLIVTDFDTFQKEFREGKYGVTAEKKETKQLSVNDLFIDTDSDMVYVCKYEGFTSVTDRYCAWIEKGEGGMGVDGLVDSCKELTMPKFFVGKPEKLYELNIKEFVKGFEDYYNEDLKRQEENFYDAFLEKIKKETIKGKVYIPKNYDELAKVWKEGVYSVVVSDMEKPKRYMFPEDGINKLCFVGIDIDDKTVWQKPQNLKKLLGVFTKLGYDVVYAGMVFNVQLPVFYFESTDGKYRLIIMPCLNNHEGENRDYIKKFGGSGVSYTEVQSGISNFDVMLKMFEGNGIQTEFVDTNEKIIERLKKEGHSEENINFSMHEQESLELDDEDDEQKQGTLNFGFFDEQAARSITNEAHTPIISECQGKIEAYKDIVWWIENDKNNSFMDDRQIVNSVLSYAKKMALNFEEHKAKAEQDKSRGYENVLKELTKKN